MATAQKRGFRLPWGGEPRNDETPPDDGPAPTGDVPVVVPEPATEDLGSGPFATAGPEAKSAGTPKVPDRVQVSWPESDRVTAGPLAAIAGRGATARPPAARVDAAPVAEAAQVDEPTAVQEPAMDDAAEADDAPMEQASAAPASAEQESGEQESGEQVEMINEIAVSAEDEVAEAALVADEAALLADEAALLADEAAINHRLMGYDAPPATAAPAAVPEPARMPRHDNPLVAGLVRAMRDAARTARDEAVATLHQQVAESETAIKTQSAETAAELRRVADADVAAIKDWSRAELARVREETDARIEARKGRLVEDTESEGHAVQDRLGNLRSTVESFEAEMARFFEALLAEEDPARLAALAEQMPAPPVLDMIAAVPAPAMAWFDDETIVDAATADEAAPDAAPATEAIVEVQPEWVAETEAEPAAEQATEPEAETAPGDEPTAETEAVMEQAAEAETEAKTETETEAETVAEAVAVADAEGLDDAAAGEALDADAAAAAEAAALAGLDRQTNLVVSGLSSVAAIASFKAALLHSDGVSAVNVTAGEAGQVLFTVTHDGQTDLRTSVASMESFETEVVADDGTTVSLVAREPAA